VNTHEQRRTNEAQSNNVDDTKRVERAKYPLFTENLASFRFSFYLNLSLENAESTLENAETFYC
jgi:hypothetical protein